MSSFHIVEEFDDIIINYYIIFRFDFKSENVTLLSSPFWASNNEVRDGMILYIYIQDVRFSSVSSMTTVSLEWMSD